MLDSSPWTMPGCAKCAHRSRPEKVNPNNYALVAVNWPMIVSFAGQSAECPRVSFNNMQEGIEAPQVQGNRAPLATPPISGSP
jgi:hypothetical protein